MHKNTISTESSKSTVKFHSVFTMPTVQRFTEMWGLLISVCDGFYFRFFRLML